MRINSTQTIVGPLMSYQAFSSPARKKQRLSSPTYDDQVADLTQEDLDAFDDIEARFSQKSHLNVKSSWRRATDTRFTSSKFKGKIDWSDPGAASSNPGPRFADESNDSNLQDDPDNPFTAGFTSAAAVAAPLPFRPPTIGFASAAKLPIQDDDYRSPSPEEHPPEPDIDAWFNPAPMGALPLFTTAKSIAAPELVGFTKASMKCVIKPSSEALAKAKALLEVWDSEDVNPASISNEASPSTSLTKADASNILKPSNVKQPVLSPQRVALRTVENVSNTPGAPPPSGFARASIAAHPRVVSSASSPSLLYRPKPFKSPLMRNMHTPNGVMSGSPLNPNRPISSLTFSNAASQLPHPLSSAVNASPGLASIPPAGFASPSSFVTPLRSTGVLRTRPAPFATPFKPGMRPGEPGRSRLGQSSAVKTPQLALNAAEKNETPQNWLTKDRPSCVLVKKEFFSLGSCTTLFPPHLCTCVVDLLLDCKVTRTDRQSLVLSGLQPQQYDADDLESMGM